MMGWLIGGGVLCMIVLMTALCVVSGDEDEQAEAAYRHFLESRGRKACSTFDPMFRSLPPSGHRLSR